jgi:integrase
VKYARYRFPLNSSYGFAGMRRCSGTAADGRLFPASGGGPIAASVYTGVWKHARMVALPPGSPLALRPYDLRHAAGWPGGVDVAEVAHRAGHTVQVLTTVYAKVLHGRDERRTTARSRNSSASLLRRLHLPL